MDVFKSICYYLDAGMMSIHSSRWWKKTNTMLLFMLVFIACLGNAAFSDDFQSDSTSKRGRYRIAEITVSLKSSKRGNPFKFQGRFALNGMVKEVHGLLLLANNSAEPKTKNDTNLGCVAYTNFKLPDTKTKWISVVRRGFCNFSTKVEVATKLMNASAVVIQHDGQGVEPIIHLANNVKNSIAISIPQKDGEHVITLLKHHTDVMMHVTPGEEHVFDHSENNISKTTLLFVSITSVVLVIISLAWLVFYYIQSLAKQRFAKRLACATKKAIAKIPQSTIKPGDKVLEGEHDQCAVCIEQYKLHDVIRILPCQHAFHKRCVDPWLQENRSCPMCKMDILVAYRMQIGTSQESVHHNAETGPSEQLIMEDPEASYNIDEAQTEVGLPLICLHSNVESTEDSDGPPATAQILGSKEEVFSSAVSLHSHNGSVSITLVEKRDVKDSDTSERKSLIEKECDNSKLNVGEPYTSEDTVDTENDPDKRKGYYRVGSKKRPEG